MITKEPLLIGILFFIVIYIARLMSYKSGSVFNPAQALALEIFQAFVDGSWFRLKTVFVYILGPFTGGIIAT